MSKKIILITGASSGFGRLTAEALAKAGNTVYASMRDTAGRNAKNTAEMAETSKRDGVDLRAIELDVQSEPSIDVAVKKIMAGLTSNSVGTTLDVEVDYSSTNPAAAVGVVKNS